ncbi:MAG: hypothetical protein RIT14_2156 [Pseudomonadota bacterium]
MTALVKRLAAVAVLGLGAGFGLAGAAAAADPVEGIWQTAPDDNGHFGHIEIAPCGEAFCGTLVKAFDETGAQTESENIGKQIVWDMVAKGEGSYEDGKVWSPDRDKTYNSYMLLEGDGLTVKGCILMICRDGGTWTRVN